MRTRWSKEEGLFGRGEGIFEVIVLRPPVGGGGGGGGGDGRLLGTGKVDEEVALGFKVGQADGCDVREALLGVVCNRLILQQGEVGVVEEKTVIIVIVFKVSAVGKCLNANAPI